MLLEKAFIEVFQIYSQFKCLHTIIENITKWLRYKFVASPKYNPLFLGIVIVSTGTWHLDLESNSWNTNIFLHTNISCQVSTRLFYIRG